MANYEFSQVSGHRPCCRLSRTAQICLGVSLIASVVIVGILLWPRAPLVWKGKPTTKHFPEIFLGRCFLYTQILRPEMSTFGSVEVFNLDPKKVHKLQAWVMHDIEADSSNSCSGSSINDLKLIVHQRNITFACQDNYRPVRFVQCVKNPEHPLCSSNI